MTFPALIAHSSPPLRLWRCAGVLLLAAQFGTDVQNYRDGKRAARISAACVAKNAPSHVEGVHCNLARTRTPFKPQTARVGIRDRREFRDRRQDRGWGRSQRGDRVRGAGSRRRRGARRGYSAETGRGDAAGRDAEIPRRRVAATPRLRAGSSAAVGRARAVSLGRALDSAAGRDAEIPWTGFRDRVWRRRRGDGPTRRENAATLRRRRGGDADPRTYRGVGGETRRAAAEARRRGGDGPPRRRRDRARRVVAAPRTAERPGKTRRRRIVPRRRPKSTPENLRDEALGARVALLAYVVWWFLLGDIILHLITGRRVEGTDDLKPLCHAYLKSYWWHIDTGLLMPGLVETVVTFVVKKVGLDHPIVFIYHRIHIIPPHRRFRPGRYIRKLIVFLVKFSLRHRRLVRGLVAEIETLAGVAEAAQMVLRETQEVAEVYEQARDFTPKGSLRLKNFTPGTGERRGSFSFDGQQALRQTNRGKAVRAEGARS